MARGDKKKQIVLWGRREPQKRKKGTQPRKDKRENDPSSSQRNQRAHQSLLGTFIYKEIKRLAQIKGKRPGSLEEKRATGSSNASKKSEQEQTKKRRKTRKV